MRVNSLRAIMAAMLDSSLRSLVLCCNWAVRQCHNGGGFRVGGGVHDSYTVPMGTGGIFHFPWHRHPIEGTDGF